MAKGKGAKKRANNRSNKKRNLGLKPHSKPQSQPQNPKQKNQKKPKKPNPIQDENPFTFGSEPESNPSSPTCIQSLLEPYTKPQLISFLLDAAVSDPELRTRIRSIADSDVSHRQLFVFGLGWDATKETLTAAFSPFGPIEDCSVVVDKNTGRAKGYAFVLFKTRSAAIKALKEPQKRIGNKVATCQLSSVGGPKPDGGRKIYVGNVPFDVSVERLREFFARFGLLESGPLGFDGATGKSKGYALFVYKTPEDAKKALEEPYKLFEGRQLYCQLATPKNEMGKVQMAVPAVSPVVPAVSPVVPAVAPMIPSAAVPTQQSVMAAMAAAAQNLAILGQNPLLLQNQLLAAAALNPALLNAAAAMGGAPGAPYGGGAAAAQHVLGGQGMGGVGFQGLQGMQGYQAGSSMQGLQGYQAGSSMQGGQSGKGSGGALGGFRSYQM